MKKLTLKRTSSTMQGVFGSLIDNEGLILCNTAERPWLDNKPDVSCIPEGTYPLLHHNSHHFGECLKVDQTYPRTRILIHKGNNPLNDSRGCILVGMQLGWLQGSTSVLHSGKAFNALMTYLNGENCMLEIEDCYS